MSSMIVIGTVGAIAFSAWILYLLRLPMGLAAWLGVIGGALVVGFVGSKLKIQIPSESEKPLSYKRGAIAVGLGVIWMISIIVALIKSENSSRNSLGIFVGGFGILFLIFGQLEWMWNRDSRPLSNRTPVRKSPNYYK